MRKLLLLLLLALPADAAEQSIAKSLYLDDIASEIQELIYKQSTGKNTEYDDFMLGRLTSRLTEEKQVGSRVVFTSGIDNREPTNVVKSATKDCGEIFLFTEIINQNGKTVTHIWYVNGEEAYSQSFSVRADKWRVWSAKAVRKAENITVLIYADDELIAATGINVL